MTQLLPPHVEKYGETRIFDECSVPAKLTNEHETKAGVWGKLCVLSGTLNYVIESDRYETRTVECGEFVIINPQQPHYVELAGPASFKVEFYR